MNILKYLRGVISQMFNRTDVAEKLGVKTVSSATMSDSIRLWADCYSGNAPWVNDTVKGLELPFACSHEMARLVTLEYTASLDGSKRAEYLSRFFSDTASKAIIYTEYACALGGVILKPYVSDDKIITDFVRADAFFPTRFSPAGDITGCIFVENMTIGDKYYTRLEYHDLNGTDYTVKNSAYVSFSKDNIGREIPLSDIPEWADLPEETVIQNMKYPLFAYFKIPGGNYIDRASPLGISIFDRAINVMEDADKQYSRLLWEMEGSELAVIADVTMIRDKKLPSRDKRLFKVFDMGAAENEIVPFSPAIREQNEINALNEILKRVEYLVGLSFGSLSSINETAKTATEIKASKQRSYSTVRSIQKSHSRAIRAYINALDELCSIYKLCPEGEINISETYDDSLVTDSEADQKIWLGEVSAGLMSPVEYRMRRYGETEEEARKNLPETFSGDE